jgi:hypothetical protein
MLWLPDNHQKLSTDVQQFSVWDKDAKDESGFVGYCYLDVFPRGTPLHQSIPDSEFISGQRPSTRMQQFGLCCQVTTALMGREATQ